MELPHCTHPASHHACSRDHLGLGRHHCATALHRFFSPQIDESLFKVYTVFQHLQHLYFRQNYHGLKIIVEKYTHSCFVLFCFNLPPHIISWWPLISVLWGLCTITTLPPLPCHSQLVALLSGSTQSCPLYGNTFTLLFTFMTSSGRSPIVRILSSFPILLFRRKD